MLLSSSIKKKFLQMRLLDRIAIYKSCNIAINFFQRIFESLLFSAEVVKLYILFWLLKYTAFFSMTSYLQRFGLLL